MSMIVCYGRTHETHLLGPNDHSPYDHRYVALAVHGHHQRPVARPTHDALVPNLGEGRMEGSLDWRGSAPSGPIA
jgi:hypothetical protein